MNSVLISNNIYGGSIKTSLKTNDYDIKVKELHRSVKNWKSICDILQVSEDSSLIVIVKFTERILMRISLPEYEEVLNRFLELLQNKKHLIFIYKKNLYGEFSCLEPNRFSHEEHSIINDLYDEEESDFLFSSDRSWKPVKEDFITTWFKRFNNIEECNLKMNQLIKKINAQNLNIQSYEKLIDIDNTGQSFIEHITTGLLFKIYVPNQRMWSSEFDKFIILFRDYASNVANKEIEVQQFRTDTGIVCSILSRNKKVTELEVNKLYQEFTNFMDMCSANPDEARKILKMSALSPDKQQIILQKYIKESKRLLLDLKHERENKLIALRHRLESDFQELSLEPEVETYLNNILPQVSSIKSILSNPRIETQIINVNPQIIHHVEGIVNGVINGNIEYTPEDKEIQKIIEKYSALSLEAENLKTALQELKDASIPKEEKGVAKQKLYSFLAKVADKIGDVGVSLLTKYLEQKI